MRLCFVMVNVIKFSICSFQTYFLETFPFFDNLMLDDQKWPTQQSRYERAYPPPWGPPRYELVLCNQWVRFWGNGTKFGQSDMVRWFLISLNLRPNIQIMISACHFRCRGIFKFNFRFKCISLKDADLNFRRSPLNNCWDMSHIIWPR